MSWKNWRGASTITSAIVHILNSKFNSATEDFAWAFRLCLSAFLSPLDRKIEFRLSTRPYTPLYPLAVYAPLVANAISAKTLSTTTALHPPPSSTYCNFYWFSEKSEMLVRDVLIHSAYWFLYIYLLRIFLLTDFFWTKRQFFTLRDWWISREITLQTIHIVVNKSKVYFFNITILYFVITNKKIANFIYRFFMHVEFKKNENL